ncbi:MAG TPA: hypothetical protein VGG42_09645 [Acidobacteriaceae bacterium]
MHWESKQARRKATRVLVAFLLAALPGWARPIRASTGIGGAQTAAATNTLTLPAGTKIELAVVRPVPARTAKVGDTLYAQTDFPVEMSGRVAIPAGAWVEGRIEALKPPSRKQARAELDVLFTTIIFANGYVVSLPDAAPGAALPADATEMQVTIQESTANDLLLDNGAQMEMALAAPLVLDADQVARAMSRTHAPGPGSLKSATTCRPTAGSPGSSGTADTVIPGMPGTPETVIPGGPGMPDTVIPGTPATPDTVIPGIPSTSGVPGTVCPPAPIVLSSVPLARAGAGTKAAANPASAPAASPVAPH